MIRKIKGTEDLLPQQTAKWQYIEETARYIFGLYHFQEIRTPLFESFDLFSRSVGDTTDIVTKEMYDFYDKGNRHIALRPEGTAPVVRAYVEHKLFAPEYPQPLKLYYIGPMFRYERPQAGRQRQFHQIGVETFGSNNPATDAETIMMAWDFLNELGVKNITLHLNSLGTPEERKTYRDALIDYYENYFEDLSEDSKRRLHDNPLRVLDSKDKMDQSLTANAPKILDYLGEQSATDFQTVQDMLTAQNIPFQVNPYIVRGLDYYQGTIFEIMVDDNAIGAQSTVCGGGRYDGLIEDLGGPQTPGVGFGLGIERLLLLIDQQEIELPIETALDVFVMVADEGGNQLAQTLIQLARQAGLASDRDFLGRSIKSQFKSVDKYQAKVTIVVGSSEVDSQQVTLKNQATGQEVVHSVAELADNFDLVFKALTTDTSVIDNFFKGAY